MNDLDEKRDLMHIVCTCIRILSLLWWVWTRTLWWSWWPSCLAWYTTSLSLQTSGYSQLVQPCRFSGCVSLPSGPTFTCVSRVEKYNTSNLLEATWENMVWNDRSIWLLVFAFPNSNSGVIYWVLLEMFAFPNSIVGSFIEYFLKCVTFTFQVRHCIVDNDISGQSKTMYSWQRYRIKDHETCIVALNFVNLNMGIVLLIFSLVYFNIFWIFFLYCFKIIF